MILISLLCLTAFLHVVVCHDHVPGEHLGHLADALSGSGGYLAGSGQMVVQSLAAGMAVNMQWFQPATATGTYFDCESDSRMYYIQTLQPVRLKQPLQQYNLAGPWPLMLGPYPPYVGEDGGCCLEVPTPRGGLWREAQSRHLFLLCEEPGEDQYSLYSQLLNQRNWRSLEIFLFLINWLQLENLQHN